MPSYRLRTGLHIRLLGRGEFSIEQRLPNGDLQLKNLATNDFMSIRESDLIKELFDGGIELLGDGKSLPLNNTLTSQQLISDLSLLSDKLKQETKRRFTYINEVMSQGLTVLTKHTLSPLIEKLKKDTNDPSPPSWITLYRWVKQYLASGKDVRSIVPAQKRRGNPRRKFCGGNAEKAEATVRIIEEVIAERYLTRERPTVESVHDTVIARIASMNEFRDADDKLSHPHKSSIYDIIKKLDAYEVTKARYGKRIADHKYGAHKQGPRPTRPLERVEIDHTKIDMMVVDPVMRLPVGRPWMTVAIDKYTRMIVGIYTSFNPPSTLSVMQCLRHAIKPKTYVSTLYPEIKNTWDAYGIFEGIVLDNAPEFYSTDLEDACLQLGISIQYTPPKRGQYKGSVERFFRTQNQQLLHGQQGTTFSNIIDREDYDPKKNAVISADALDEMTHIFIVDVYHQRVHRGLNDTPARVWVQASAEFPPTLPSRPTDLDVILGCIEHRTICASGIELHGLSYNSESLARLRRELRSGERVMLKYDPSNLSIIHVADKTNGLYVAVPALNQEYAEGLSLWQHKFIKRYVREVLRSNVDVVALCLAKERIQRIVEREWLSTKKTTTRQRLARLKGFGQRGYIDTQSPSTNTPYFPNNHMNSPSLMDNRALGGVSAIGASFAESLNADSAQDNNHTEVISIHSSATKGGSEGEASPTPLSESPNPSEAQIASSNDIAEGGTGIDITGWGGDYDLPR